MKRKSKIILVITFSVICIMFLINQFSKSELEKEIISCRDYYKSSMKLDYVICNQEKQHIKICFELKHGFIEKTLDDISTSYSAITDVLIRDKKSKYKDFSVDISYVYIADILGINNINNSLDSTELYTDVSIGISLKKLAKLFPDIRKLDLDSPIYNDISDIEGFSQLDYVHFAGGITAEEKKYILSIYPECEVDEHADYH